MISERKVRRQPHPQNAFLTRIDFHEMAVGKSVRMDAILLQRLDDFPYRVDAG